MLTQHEISEQEHQSWFDKASQDDNRALFVAEQHDTLVGYVQFSGVEKDGVANWGFYLAPDAARGTGRELGRAALRMAFTQLQLHKVCGQALAFNSPSIKFHKNLGFVQEGIFRQHSQLLGHYHDLVCFGLLRNDWSNGQST